MDTIFMNSANSKTPKPNRLILRLQNKMDLSLRKKSVALANLSIYYSWKNISSELKNNKLIIGYDDSDQEWTVPIVDGSYSAKTISDYIFGSIEENRDRDKDSFWNNAKKRGDEPSEIFKLYHDKIRNRTAYVIKNKYYIKLPTKEIRHLLGISKEKIEGSDYGDLVPQIEPVTAVLVNCNIVDNEYQRNSKLLYSFVPDKPFGSLLHIEPKSEIFAKTFAGGFYDINVWFTDQNGNDLKIEDAISLTLVIRDEARSVLV